eukprot:CAMPEP_0202061840 /NCGR_PEP_ID=MMETSP0963-20130614/42234_1 /ASSEMBLY_ACC=CAM_ASM_000494 /TAXON_ID=4773 /ORGANISM="Schizochytrium aggregatum, Strain ATCC28209" /LENGTH=34 /DNA_ID= /DNA_START= /DNA_END= /DNA_ORIENTATION=
MAFCSSMALCTRALARFLIANASTTGSASGPSSS